ncbi:sigma-70 family RNA polymerase sigma factor [Lysinibacillus piscis]|uniref:RNA polymerase subunit sigma n=1 Tax=Lysinibacillus piscis TaxID=2518931 RepID=A0ABQ5NKI6_9BACI|nr:sigma-70 family RNA polymerase sigma factor [Lysinibacillus sp. KH24]GLC88534.1 RNA polymerase subunit sigma [Lysinibacillus sp. KH24]
MQIEQIIHTYGDYLYRVAFIYTKDINAAEEVVQDVFFNYSRKSIQYKGDATLKTYLVKMTINRSYDYLRSWKNKRLVLLEKIQGKPSPTTEQLLIQMESRGEVTKAVLALPIKYREIILLYYYEDFSIREIATLTNTLESTLKSRLQRAREKLKITLQDKEVLEDETIQTRIE